MSVQPKPVFIWRKLTSATLKLSTVAVWLIALGEILLLILPKETAGSTVASTVALIIAFVAYPHQKDVDRRLELRRERRAVYRSYLSLASEIVGEIRNPALIEIKPPSRSFIELKGLIDRMISAETEVCLVSTRPVRSAVIQFNIFTAEMLGKVLEAVKSRAESADEVSWQEIIFALDNCLKKKFERKHVELYEVMRQEQFDDVAR